MDNIQKSATVVLLREADCGFEVLLLRRSASLRAFAGCWVFPGGKIDGEDAGLTDEQKARAAAVRETEEESGQTILADDLHFFAHWTTPDNFPRRFATWFFVTEIRHADAVVIDNSEIHDHSWLTPQLALEQHRCGEMELMPPTFVTLHNLVAYGSVTEALVGLATAPAIIYEPRVVRQTEQNVHLYPGDAGWETRDVDLSGPRHRLVSQGQDWYYEYEL